MSALRERWAAFTPRERLMLSVLGVVFAIILFLVLIVRPLTNMQTSGVAAFQEAARTRAAVARAAGQGQSRADTGTGPLRGAVSSAADAAGIVIDRYDIQEDALDVTVTEVAAPTLYAWLDDLSRTEGVTVREGTVRAAGDGGLVTARLTLARG